MAVKTVTINGEDVKFKITGLTPVLYMAQNGGKDFLGDFMKLEKEMKDGEIQNTMPIYRICYCLAKQANSEIEDMESWLDSFEAGFPVYDVLQELMPLIQLNLTSGKLPAKKKNRAKNR